MSRRKEMQMANVVTTYLSMTSTVQMNLACILQKYLNSTDSVLSRLAPDADVL